MHPLLTGSTTGSKLVRRLAVSGICAIFFTAVLPGTAAAILTPEVASLQVGESMVLEGEKPARFAFVPENAESIEIRSTYRIGLPQTILYQAGRDYLVGSDGLIRRTLNSRIPDFRTNPLFGRVDFDHRNYPGYGNGRFFVFVDYSYRGKWSPLAPRTDLGSARLVGVQRKLVNGQKVKIVAFGDSVTAGGESSEPRLIYWERWTESLRLKYPLAKIETVNSGIGGDSSVEGLLRLKKDVLEHKPDLVLIAFGLNDFNKAPKRSFWQKLVVSFDRVRERLGGPVAPKRPREIMPSSFVADLQAMIDRVRAETSAEIVLVSALTPNPNWHFSQGDMGAFAAATEQLALANRCAYADVYRNWMGFLDKKKSEDLLGNNVNHPNDFGHWIYFQALKALAL
ncbi:MAG: GDSL-type esterase/lipase family protein [Pseudomonadota bacterium]